MRNSSRHNGQQAVRAVVTDAGIPLPRSLSSSSFCDRVRDARGIKPPGQKGSEGGFSLVEVVIAIGLASFALMALLGLLPVGLSTYKQSVSSTMGAQIVQRIFTDAQIASLSNLQNTNRFFDEQGTELTSSNAVNCIYWVQVTYSTNSSGSNATTFLGNTSINLVTATVKIALNPGGSLSSSNVFSATNSSMLVYSTLIGRSQ